MYKVAVDNEVDAALWWERVHAGELETAPEEIRSLLQVGGPSYAVVDNSDPIIAWAEQIPGWNISKTPKSVKHPLYFIWIEE